MGSETLWPGWAGAAAPDTAVGDKVGAGGEEGDKSAWRREGLKDPAGTALRRGACGGQERAAQAAGGTGPEAAHDAGDTFPLRRG